MSLQVSHLRLVSTGRQTECPKSTRPAGDRPAGDPARRKPLGQILVDGGQLDPGDLLKAVAMRARQDSRLGEILVAQGWAREDDILAALGRQWNTRIVARGSLRPDPRLVDAVGIETCLRGGFTPWQRLAGGTVVVTSRPDRFAEDVARLPAALGPFVMAIASERSIHEALLSVRRTALVRRAETRVPASESCRRAGPPRAGIWMAAALAVSAGLFAAAPGVVIGILTAWSLLTLVLCTALKLAAAAALIGGGTAARGRPLRNTRRAPLGSGPRAEATGTAEATGAAPNAAPGPAHSAPPAEGRLPMVSVIVPLFRESDIAGRLLRRISRIDYPRELLDVVLVVEAEDRATRSVLERTRLPGWMRVIVAPDGPLRTKPRALNLALDFCRGQIVGVWDAEDAPAPSQIRDVVHHFASAPPEVACVQGVLDFYNRRRNWLSRCFAIEYAAWFRVILPGLARLGLVVPLGGTTLFFRRAALDALGGWDAHNVTEDADLGLRLARHGYRTDVIGTVTEEEPNARLVPWIRQRSRWLKGYAITWAVHMRSPRALLAALGWRRFLGVQVIFLGTLSQFILAPVIWTYWVLAFRASDSAGGGAADGVWSEPAVPLAALFLAAEAVNIAIGVAGVLRAGHLDLLKWVPTLVVYFPLGTFAAVKALYEAAARPFHWDKTEHGVMDDDDTPPASAAAAQAAEATVTPLRRPDAAPVGPSAAFRGMPVPARPLPRVAPAPARTWPRPAGLPAVFARPAVFASPAVFARPGVVASPAATVTAPAVPGEEMPADRA
ncbi:MAG: glycosyltransferase [Pseudomonadota bacterium]